MATVIDYDILDKKPPCLVEGNSIMSDGRVFVVSGITGVTSAVAEALVATGLPAPWTVHPYLTTLNLVGYQVELIGDGKAYVICNYQNVQPQIYIRISSALESYQTDMNRQKTPVVVSNQNASATPPVTATSRKVQSAVMSVLRPQPMIVIRRIFPDPNYGGPDPMDIAANYVGCTNSGTFCGCSEGSVMFWSFDADNTGMAGIAYRADMIFRVRKQGWNPEVAWFDRDTGEPGAQLVKASGFDNGVISSPTDQTVGRKIVDAYEQVNLNFLLA